MPWVRKAPPVVPAPVAPPADCAPAAPQPATIQEAKAAGAVEGTMLQAPLAPATGPITGPAESLTVVTVKNFWQSATVKALRNAVATAVGLALLIVAAQIVSANGDLTAINWQTTQKAAIAAGAFSLASGYAAWWKSRDNNPVKGGS